MLKYRLKIKRETKMRKMRNKRNQTHLDESGSSPAMPTGIPWARD